MNSVVVHSHKITGGLDDLLTMNVMVAELSYYEQLHYIFLSVISTANVKEIN